MLNQIQNLIAQDVQLQQKLKEVSSLQEAVEFVITNGREKGYSFVADKVVTVLQLLLNQGSVELSEDDLLSVAGGMYCAKTCNESAVNPTIRYCDLYL